MRHLLLLGVLASTLAAKAEIPSGTFVFPTIGSKAARRATLLAIDDYCLPLKKNLCYYLSKPKVRPEAVIRPEMDNPNAPDNLAAHFYGTVLHEQGKFRMWYYPMSWRVQHAQWREGPPCYAESSDGIRWKKPILGQVSFHGSTGNNAIEVPASPVICGVFVIRDDQDPDARRRYKMVYEYVPPGAHQASARTATSADGLRWTAGPDRPIEAGIEPISLYQHNGLYFVNCQYTPHFFSEGGHAAGREGFVWLSRDFNAWLPEHGESFALPAARDPKARGLHMREPQVHMGTAAVSMGNVLVGLYGFWHDRTGPGEHFGFGKTGCDLGLVVSHDGQHFREPVKGAVFLAREDSMPSVPQGVRFQNILCQGNGILNVGDETLIYHGRWANTEHTKDYYAEIALATLPRDRWGAIGLVPNAAAGTAWTAPITLPQAPSRLTLNAEGARQMRVEIADEDFTVFPRFAAANSGVCKDAQGLDCPVQWPHARLPVLAGKTVRFRIHLSKADRANPRLYACYLTVEPAVPCDRGNEKR